MNVDQHDPLRNAHAVELQALRGSWGWFLFLGIAMLILGTLALSRPVITALAGEFVFAVMLLVGAGIEIASAVWAGKWRGFFYHLLTGLLYLVVGCFMLEDPGRGIAGLTLLLAASFMAKGVLGIIIAITQRFDGWIWIFLNGVISLALGILIWRKWPEDSVFFLTLYLGIEILITGWSWIMLAVTARSIPPAPAT